jgi:hypothetical protein
MNFFAKDAKMKGIRKSSAWEAWKVIAHRKWGLCKIFFKTIASFLEAMVVKGVDDIIFFPIVRRPSSTCRHKDPA